MHNDSKVGCEQRIRIGQCCPKDDGEALIGGPANRDEAGVPLANNNLRPRSNLGRAFLHAGVISGLRLQVRLNSYLWTKSGRTFIIIYAPLFVRPGTHPPGGAEHLNIDRSSLKSYHAMGRNIIALIIKHLSLGG